MEDVPGFKSGIFKYALPYAVVFTVYVFPLNTNLTYLLASALPFFVSLTLNFDPSL